MAYEFDEDCVDMYMQSDESWRYSLDIGNYFFMQSDMKQAAYWFIKASIEGDPDAWAMLNAEGFIVDEVNARWVRRVARHWTREYPRRSE